MITELYYGSIQLILNKEFKTEIEGSLDQAKLNVLETVEFDKSIEYTFDHNKVPFAMRLEKVRQFQG
jgi:hypothetical protein